MCSILFIFWSVIQKFRSQFLEGKKVPLIFHHSALKTKFIIPKIISVYSSFLCCCKLLLPQPIFLICHNFKIMRKTWSFYKIFLILSEQIIIIINKLSECELSETGSNLQPRLEVFTVWGLRPEGTNASVNGRAKETEIDTKWETEREIDWRTERIQSVFECFFHSSTNGSKRRSGHNVHLEHCIHAGFTSSTKSQRRKTSIQQRKDNGQTPCCHVWLVAFVHYWQHRK